MKPRPKVMGNTWCILIQTICAGKSYDWKASFIWSFKKQFYIISDMVFFFVCKIISIPEVILVLGVEVQVSFFLMSVSLRGRKMGMKSKTPSNATLPWVFIITVSNCVITTKLCNNHYHHHTELPGNILRVAFKSYTERQKDHCQNPTSAILLESLCHFIM